MAWVVAAVALVTVHPEPDRAVLVSLVAQLTGLTGEGQPGQLSGGASTLGRARLCGRGRACGGVQPLGGGAGRGGLGGVLLGCRGVRRRLRRARPAW